MVRWASITVRKIASMLKSGGALVCQGRDAVPGPRRLATGRNLPLELGKGGPKGARLLMKSVAALVNGAERTLFHYSDVNLLGGTISKRRHGCGLLSLKGEGETLPTPGDFSGRPPL